MYTTIESHKPGAREIDENRGPFEVEADGECDNEASSIDGLSS